MYLNKLKKTNGDIYLSIREKYHVPKVGSRERTIESIGYVSELRKKYDDPIAYFTMYAKELTEKANAEKTEDITIDLKSTMDIGTNDVRNVGYGILSPNKDFCASLMHLFQRNPMIGIYSISVT